MCAYKSITGGGERRSVAYILPSFNGYSSVNVLKLYIEEVEVRTSDQWPAGFSKLS